MGGMDPTARRLVHEVNNLLAVIETQAAVADAVDTDEARRQALVFIRKRAAQLADELRALRPEGGAADSS